MAQRLDEELLEQAALELAPQLKLSFGFGDHFVEGIKAIGDLVLFVNRCR